VLEVLQSDRELKALVVMAIVGGPIGLAILFRPQRGFLALVALAPFEGLLEIGPPVPHGTSLAEALVVLSFVASMLAPRETRAPNAALPQWVPVYVLFAALGLASAIAVHSTQALFGVKIVYFYVLLGIAVWRCPLDARERDFLVSILMFDGVVTAAYGVLQQVMGAARLNALGYEYNTTIRFAGHFLRSFSTFIQPFGFGLFEALVLVVCVPVALGNPNRPRNRLFLYLAPLLAAGLVTSIVRAAWMGAAVGLGYVVSSRHRRLLVLVPLVFGLTLLIPPEAARTAFSSTSTNERATGWRENANLVTEHPLGLGVGATGSAAITAAGHGAKITTRYQPDNWYVKLLLELGVLGVWAFVVFLVTAIVTTHRRARRLAGDDGALVTGVVAMLLAAAMASLTATYFEIFPLDLLFWLLLVTAARIELSPARDDVQGPVRRTLAR
jgi:hypothetical protein